MDNKVKSKVIKTVWIILLVLILMGIVFSLELSPDKPTKDKDDPISKVIKGDYKLDKIIVNDTKELKESFLITPNDMSVGLCIGDCTTKDTLPTNTTTTTTSTSTTTSTTTTLPPTTTTTKPKKP